MLQSKEQIHSFNTPYQVTRLPTIRGLEYLRKNGHDSELNNLRSALKKKTFCEDQPEDSDIYQVRVREGDLLIICTDGIFDNLFLDEITKIVQENTQNAFRTKSSAKNLAKKLVEAAKEKANDGKARTPFGVKK